MTVMSLLLQVNINCQLFLQIAETAEKLGILVMADESYGHLAYGSTPFTPMGVFGSVVPVITVGSLSKRWFVPGWRLGWIAISDPACILQGSEVLLSTHFLFLEILIY